MHRRVLMPLLLAAVFSSILSLDSSAAPFTIDGSTVYVNAGLVGVRTSTPTTVFDVNGDAQFGSGASKSTFTAAGLLKLTSAGIQWADGTTSTTSSAGGGAAAVSGTWSTVSSVTFTSSSTITLDSIVSSNTYHLVCNVIPKTTAGYIYMRVDGANTGSNYLWQQDLTANGVLSSGGGVAATSCMVSYNTGAYFPNTDDPYHFEAQFGTWNQGQKKVDITSIGSYSANSGDRVTHRNQCFYANGAGSVTDITIILNGGGTLAGDCRLAVLDK